MTDRTQNPEKRGSLAVVIPTKNAGHLLEDCLSSVSFADQIIVVDMHSEDDTADVCAKFEQCELLERDDYIFANVNFGFDRATTDWVMRLDADERLTPELVDEVRGIIAKPVDGVIGYEFWERPVILGHELKHGFGVQHYRKMMFRNGTARYPVRSEHEDLESDGEWQRCRHGYLHFNYFTVGQYLTKTDYYTSRDIERLELPEAAPSRREAAVSVARAFYLYYLKYRGYRDGWVGFVDAGMRAFYQFVYWAKLRERWSKERDSYS
jgi:glycosyltransferase involved in cell wall biosynthesis